MFHVIPFCPEVAIGLGVPRPKIQAVSQKDRTMRILGVESHRLDVTDPLRLYARDFLQQHADLQYFIVKSKSPSCGFQSTPLFAKQESKNKEGALTYENNHYKQIALTSGLFVLTLLEMKSELFIMDELSLTTEQDCLNFINLTADL
jgi:uncharacterized protein YbbK (DUF523 family)